jgi:pyridoxine 5-phosphate synthase
MARLCLCVNQVARLRRLNNKREPDPVNVAMAAEIAGIDGVVVQLDQNRAEITDRDVQILKEVVKSHLNLAIPVEEEMVKKALQVMPDMVTLLPATDDESVSLDLEMNLESVEEMAATLRAHNIVVSALIAPESNQVRAAARAGMDYVQLNTYPFSLVDDLGTMTEQVGRIRTVALAAHKLGMGVSAGRGLSYQNVREIGGIEVIEECNVGKPIISRALLVGIDRAVIHFKSQMIGK